MGLVISLSAERERRQQQEQQWRDAWIATYREQLPGLRQATDGHWYLPDVQRPGRYLMLVEPWPCPVPSCPCQPYRRGFETTGR
jgi:hypothetical protein